MIIYYAEESGKNQIEKKNQANDEQGSRYSTVECNQQDSTPLIQREKPSKLVEEQDQQSSKRSQQENGISNIEGNHGRL